MDEIGGYFELHIEAAGKLPYPSGLYFNTGRSALAYFLGCRKPASVWLPEYICPSLSPVIKKSVARLFRYRVDRQLYPLIDERVLRDKKSVVVIVNYFGVRDDLLRRYRRYKHSIIWDMSQAFYCRLPAGHSGFYSPRKFFGVPDGGILVGSGIPRKRYNRLAASNAQDKVAHLVKRIESGASAGYNDFKRSSRLLAAEGLKRMSNLSSALLRSVDYAKAARARSNNYSFLHRRLGKINALELPGSCRAPMVYPLRLPHGCVKMRERLIRKKVYIPAYWPDCKTAGSRELADSILALPLDQRYGIEEMKYIIKLIGGYLGNKNILQGP